MSGYSQAEVDRIAALLVLSLAELMVLGTSEQVRRIVTGEG